MSSVSWITSTAGLEWGLLDGGDLPLPGAREQITALGAGWRLPTVRDLVAAFDYDRWGGEFGRAMIQTSASPRGGLSRCWCAHDAALNTDKPHGLQFIFWTGAVWPTPMSYAMPVVVVRPLGVA